MLKIIEENLLLGRENDVKKYLSLRSGNVIEEKMSLERTNGSEKMINWIGKRSWRRCQWRRY
jgi:hypothetical protein